MGGQFPASLMEGLEVAVCWLYYTLLYGFQMCISSCMYASLPSCWVQSSMVLRARDLCRSNSVGLISYIHKQVTKSCFFGGVFVGQHPFNSSWGLIDAVSLKMLLDQISIPPSHLNTRYRNKHLNLVQWLGATFIVWPFHNVINSVSKLSLWEETGWPCNIS